MKHFTPFLMVLVLTGCQDIDTPTDFTGYETTYELVAASIYEVKGVITFRERLDGFTTVTISLSGTDGDAKHPVHLHLGNLSTPGADIAAILSPVVAKTGKSETTLTSLADETPITYADLSTLHACVKIHLSDVGAERDIVLAGGNVGASYLESISTGKQDIAPCKGN